MKLGTTNHPCVGKRVQIPAYTDLWMRMDHPQVKRLARIIADDCKFIDTPAVQYFPARRG